LAVGQQVPSAQSTRPLQLLSMPSLQISTVPPGQVVQVEGDDALQVCPSVSQVTPTQALGPQVEQVGVATVQVRRTGSQARPNSQVLEAQLGS